MLFRHWWQKTLIMKTLTVEQYQQLEQAEKYITNVAKWIELTYGKEAAEKWLQDGATDYKYMQEYNTAYEAFVKKVLNLNKRQKEAVTEVLYTTVYSRMQNEKLYNRLFKRLENI